MEKLISLEVMIVFPCIKPTTLKPLKVSFLWTKFSDNLPSQTTKSDEDTEGRDFYLNGVSVYGGIKSKDLLDESQLSVNFTHTHFWIMGIFTHTLGVTRVVIQKNSFPQARECLEILYCHKVEAEFPQGPQVHIYYPMYSLKQYWYRFFMKAADYLTFFSFVIPPLLRLTKSINSFKAIQIHDFTTCCIS